MMPIALLPATKDALFWARERVIKGHYLHTVPDPRTRSFCYVVELGPQRWRIGCLWFGRPEATRCYQGGLTYGSLQDVREKRAAFDRWEILCLSRVWLSPHVQAGGKWHHAEHLPGFVDRKGVFRSELASFVIRRSLTMIGADYLETHPPCFVNEPYMIRAVMSYCDRRLHKGTIYRASGFTLARTNAAGIETWWTPDVAPLTPAEDADIREAARINPRSQRIREAREAASVS